MSDPSQWVCSLKYVDMHCHVDLYPDPKVIMQEAQQMAIGVVAVTNIPSVFEPMLRLASGFSNVVVALGLHPELAVERESELRLVPQLMAKTRFIGEVGFDGTALKPEAKQSQLRVLRAFAEGVKGDESKIMTVHTRRAVRMSLDVLANVSGPIVLHWFSGSLSEAKEAVEKGWWFSVNLAMLESSRGRSILSAIPANRVLTESDGPFARGRGKPLRPVDVIEVVQELASIWKIEREEARSLVMDNFRRCVSRGEI